MSSIYAPTPVSLGSITLPSDGDTRNAASVNVPVQAIADAVAYERDKIDAEVARAVAVDNDILACYQLVDVVLAPNAGLSVSLANGGTTTQTVSVANASISTLAGDKVEIHLHSSFEFINSATITVPHIITTKLQANQNGGGLVDIVGAQAVVQSATVASKAQRLPLAISGAFSIATPGTLNISALFTLSSSNSGDVSGIGSPSTAVLKIYRLL